MTQTKRYDDAFAETGTSLALDNGDPQAHTHYARLLAARGERDQALTHLQTALAINPRFAPARMMYEKLSGARP